jgi:hypothetical protein
MPFLNLLGRPEAMVFTKAMRGVELLELFKDTRYNENAYTYFGARLGSGAMEVWGMLLYHGSNLEVAAPRLIEQTRGLDFGSGFYLTTSEEQANRFSEIVVKRRKGGIATVNVYEFDMETAEKTLAVRKFASADAQWLSFVTGNRLKTYNGDEYDMIVGAVANDTVMPTIQALLGGFLTEEATLVTLKTSKLVDQTCLKTDKAISLLRFVRSYNARKGGARNG